MMRDPIFDVALMTSFVLIAALIVAVVVSQPAEAHGLRNAYYPYSVETQVRDR